MRASEFWVLAEGEFGRAYAHSLAADLVIPALGDRTPDEALAAGLQPRDVWAAMCDMLEVPPERRWGRDPGRGQSGRGAGGPSTGGRGAGGRG